MVLMKTPTTKTHAAALRAIAADPVYIATHRAPTPKTTAPSAKTLALLALAATQADDLDANAGRWL